MDVLDAPLTDLKKFNQSHLYAHLEKLDPAKKQDLLKEISQINFQELDSIIQKSNSPENQKIEGIQPAPYIRLPQDIEEKKEWQKAYNIGEEILKQGKVCALVVAGGQGTRLGWNGPKGTFPVTPIKQKSLFEVFAKKIQAARLRYGQEIPWLIMTSQINELPTKNFFKENNYFGMDEKSILFFCQGLMPAVDFEGKIILEKEGQIAMSPDGHGGIFKALHKNKLLQFLKDKNIEYISYFQVDNPLTDCIDPAFIGFHALNQSDMSSKMVTKKQPDEKVGHFCINKETLSIIEYSDIPECFTQKKDSSGQLEFCSGNIAVHILSLSFAEKVATSSLKFHQAKKKIPTLGENGTTITPEKPNGIKFEQFIFDALPLANNPIIIEVKRNEHFSPVKNASGSDSPKTCQTDQSDLYKSWLQEAKLTPPKGWVEVCPLFAEKKEIFLEKIPNYNLKETQNLYIQ